VAASRNSTSFRLPGEGKHTVSFLLLPEYSAMALFSAVETLRVANRFSPGLFAWAFYTVDGRPAPSSSGIELVVAGSIHDLEAPSCLLICAGFSPERAISRREHALLRRFARFGTLLGGIDTGAFILARAGLLDGYRFTLHWEAVPGFREEFPRLEPSLSLFEADRDRLTCAGGTAAIDMMLSMIIAEHGHPLAVQISEQFMHQRIRRAEDHQRMKPGLRLGVDDKQLAAAVTLMEATLENPLDVAALARRAGLSRRRLERLFTRHVRMPPAQYYLGLRLARARELVHDSTLPIGEVAVACGFSSLAELSRAYRRRFGLPPRDDRAAARGR
jgi:AraC family carnitine catabolism transcriptional activator